MQATTIDKQAGRLLHLPHMALALAPMERTR